MFVFWNTPTQEQIDQRNKREADYSNKKWFPHIFAKTANRFSKDWFVMDVSWIYGGYIKMINKKYPNVYLCANMVYDNIDAPLSKMVTDFKFYIDENHWSNIIISDLDLLNEEYDFDNIIEITIDNYCKSLAHNGYKIDDKSSDRFYNHEYFKNYLVVNTGEEIKKLRLDEIRKYKNKSIVYKLELIGVPNDNSSNLESGFVGSMAVQYEVQYSSTMDFIVNTILHRLETPHVMREVPELEKTEPDLLDKMSKALIITLIGSIVAIFVMGVI